MFFVFSFTVTFVLESVLVAKPVILGFFSILFLFCNFCTKINLLSLTSIDRKGTQTHNPLFCKLKLKSFTDMLNSYISKCVYVMVKTQLTSSIRYPIFSLSYL